MSGLRDLSVGRFVLPASLLTVKFARSGGPGGQNVNKVASKADVRLDLAGAAEFLGESGVARIREKLEARIDKAGALIITSSEHRDQPRNVEAALARMEALLTAALARPKARIATKPSRGAKERRLGEKKARSEIKKGRSGQGQD